MTEARTVTLAIIGGGPAGLAAATKASELGIDAILLDMHPQTGGHYLVSPAVQSDKTASTTNLDDDFALRAAAADCHTEIWSETVVWGLYKESPFLLTLDGEGGRQLRARYVIVSAGAYDRPVPFPGWTLPGVMTAGAVQVLLKSQRVLPGQRFLLAGTGPLQLSVAAHLAAAGADIAAMLELRGLSMLLGNWRYAPVLLGQGKRMAEGWQYLRAMRQAPHARTSRLDHLARRGRRPGRASDHRARRPRGQTHRRLRGNHRRRHHLPGLWPASLDRTMQRGRL